MLSEGKYSQYKNGVLPNETIHVVLKEGEGFSLLQGRGGVNFCMSGQDNYHH